MRAVALAGVAGFACLASPAFALDLNSFRAQHKLPPLVYSSAYAAAAQAHARDLARRDHLDHAGFQGRLGALASRAAENVAYFQCPRARVQTAPLLAGLFGNGGSTSGCASQARVIATWAHSAGHRRNMLMKGISHYGIADAVSASGKHYWVLELGN